jgi:high affinity Mn2+ porin
MLAIARHLPKAFRQPMKMPKCGTPKGKQPSSLSTNPLSMRLMRAARANSYSISSTAYLGWRIHGNAHSSTELYFNPEVVMGESLSNLTGLAGLNNAEQQKVSGNRPSVYASRLFVRQVWSRGEEREQVESSPNQLRGSRSTERWVLTAGKLAVNDLFDLNEYTGNVRTQFLNWSFLTHGAYDFAADAQGFTWGVALEYIQPTWAVRVGRFLEPIQSNGQALNGRIFNSYGDQIEYEQSYRLSGQQGKWRILAFRNVAEMGDYNEALQRASGQSTSPDFNSVRRSQSKVGLGLALEHRMSPSLGLFARIAAHDGRTETYSFTEIDQSASLGLKLSGSGWQRPQDQLGIALAVNALSDSHRAYLAAGGYGFFIGDGQLPNYQTEQIFETYYLAQWGKQQFSLDYQWIRNPAYNADRGPVQFYGLRWHTDF